MRPLGNGLIGRSLKKGRTKACAAPRKFINWSFMTRKSKIDKEGVSMIKVRRGMTTSESHVSLEEARERQVL